MNFNHVLIDGDILAYKSSFSCQKTTYHVMIELEGVEDHLFEICSTLRAAREMAALLESSYIRGYKIVEDKYVLKSRINDLVRSILKELNCNTYSVILGHESKEKSFRHKIAVTAPYKGNRKEGDKPKLLNDARAYIIKQYSPEIAPEELESDDLLGIMLTEDPQSIVATIDKDLDMIPGWHYNIDTKEKYFAKDPGELELVRENRSSPKLRGTGFKFFCSQMITGDRVDNIKGIEGLGPVKVFNLFDGLDTKKDMWAKVCETYKTEEQKARFVENMQLLWIRRSRVLDTDCIEPLTLLWD